MFKMTKAVAVLASVMVAGSAFAGEVDQRERNQQARIDQGVRSGQLTGRETARLERKEARINAQVRAERAANGGRLTCAERRQVNREQNRLGRHIYREKHDGQFR